MTDQLEKDLELEENEISQTDLEKDITEEDFDPTNSDVETDSDTAEEIIEDIPQDFMDFADRETQSYTKLSDKYADIMSSATTMLGVGIVGIIFLVLVFCKVIPLPLSSSTSWLFNSVMGGIFIIFIIAGVVSYMHAKQVKIDAKEEDALISQIQEWSEENITKEDLDQNLDTSQPEELLYFSRAEKIKNTLMHEFENADEALVAEMTEEIYQKLYEE